MSAKKWGHDELANDLAGHLRSNPALMVWTDMQMGPSGSQRPDVYVMEKSFARFQPKTYEIKVSLADFRRDVTEGKWQGYLDYSSAVIFAVPAGLVTKADIPNGCGLIVRHDSVWRMAKKPTLNPVDTLPRKAWQKLLIDGVERMHHTRLRERPSVSWMDVQDRIRKKFGEELGGLIATAMRSKEDLEYRTARWKAELEAQQRRYEEARASNQSRMDDYQRQLTEQQKQLCRELHISPDSNIIALIGAVRNAAHRLRKDDEIERLERQLQNIKRAFEEGLKPLPGEDVE